MDGVYKDTVVPLDGSKLAESALDTVAPMVADEDGTIHLVMVIDGVVQHALAEFADAEEITVMEAAENYLERVSVDLERRGVNVDARVLVDPIAADGILQAAERVDASCIALASHGRSGFTRWLLGSVADKVVRSTTIPVMVVPSR